MSTSLLGDENCENRLTSITGNGDEDEDEDISEGAKLHPLTMYCDGGSSLFIDISSTLGFWAIFQEED